ncbi:hypothetical protein [Dolichospermum heterosporum]|uniref:Bacteriocin n=1 Tax=Dolichospermum heterosporum TAC447 TaxID=747523 RepID=A0ABY5LSY7_9CYAN|nr:hypothetical protein [Dolichospermum heterosporum]UUO14001.1 hypothetical protein NG743_18365 [Dolichospermum heterosporum TAC447]
MSQINNLEHKELFTQLSLEESATVSGGDAAAAAAALAGFLAANGSARLTPAQAVMVIATALV